MRTDTVTGARTEVTLLVDLPIERVWELVTDVPRHGEWSPECVHTAWLDEAAHHEVGDRFAGRNVFPNGHEATADCVVAELARPEVFAWHVLDDEERPGSIWRYELTRDGADRTRLVHSFEHGPGNTGARVMAEESPTGLDERLGQIRRNITASLGAMLDGTSYREVEPA